MAEGVQRIGSLIRVVQVGGRGEPGVAGGDGGQVIFGVEAPTVPGPWVWYELDPDTGELVDIHIEGAP